MHTLKRRNRSRISLVLGGISGFLVFLSVFAFFQVQFPALFQPSARSLYSVFFALLIGGITGAAVHGALSGFSARKSW